MTGSSPTLIVTGASGHLARRVLELLHEQSAGVLVATSRNVDRLTALSDRGVDVREADFDRPETLTRAFAGAGRILIVSTDQLAIPGQRQGQHRAALDAALRAGASHVCYTSMPDPKDDSPITFAPDHVAMERDLAECGVDYTVLRNSWYSEDLFLLLPHVLRTGRWYTSAGEGRIAFVSRDDTARAAAAALRDVTGKKTYEIAGPQAFTVPELAALASEVFDRRIEVIPTSDEELAFRLREQGVPDFYVPMAVMTDANQRIGGFEVASKALEDLTGRAPEDLRSFLVRNRSAFMATTPSVA